MGKNRKKKGEKIKQRQLKIDLTKVIQLKFCEKNSLYISKNIHCVHFRKRQCQGASIPKNDHTYWINSIRSIAKTTELTLPIQNCLPSKNSHHKWNCVDSICLLVSMVVFSPREFDSSINILRFVLNFESIFFAYHIKKLSQQHITINSNIGCFQKQKSFSFHAVSWKIKWTAQL